MTTTAMHPPINAQPVPDDARRAVTIAVVLLAAVASIAAAAQLVVPVGELAHQVYPYQPDPPDNLAATGLLVHNATIALAPLLLWATRWHTSPAWRTAGDALVTAILTYNTVALGLGIGAWPHVIVHVPHLPLELAALACGATAWHTLSRGAPIRRGLTYAALTLALLVAASVIEIAAAPR